jgi:hypothetical protein
MEDLITESLKTCSGITDWTNTCLPFVGNRLRLYRQLALKILFQTVRQGGLRFSDLEHAYSRNWNDHPLWQQYFADALPMLINCIPVASVDRVCELFADTIRYLSDADARTIAARNVSALVDLVRAGSLDAQDVLGMFRDALHVKKDIKSHSLKLDAHGMSGLLDCLPAYAPILPHNVLRYYELFMNALMARHVDFWGYKSNGTFVGHAEMEHLSLSLAKALRSLHHEVAQGTRHDFFNLALRARAEYLRLKWLSGISRALPKRSPPSTVECLYAALRSPYKRLGGNELAELVDILEDRYRFARQNPELLVEGGFTSDAIYNLTRDVAKFALPAQNRAEERVYALRKELGPFAQFIAHKRGSVIEVDGISILLLEHLGKRIGGDLRATALYESLPGTGLLPWKSGQPGPDRAMLNVFLLGYAHQWLLRAAQSSTAMERGISFPEVRYETLAGEPWHAVIKVPLPETSDKTYHETMRPIPDDLVRRTGRVVEAYMRYARHPSTGDNSYWSDVQIAITGFSVAGEAESYQSSLPIILGDNKIIENMTNAHLHDFAMVGRGLEIEDIVHGVVEPRLGIPLSKRAEYVRAYARMRCLHDPGFREQVGRGKLKEMLAFMDAATVLALSVYAGCTRKRVKQMEDGSIWPRRQYFINALQWMLDHGDFTAVGV